MTNTIIDVTNAGSSVNLLNSAARTATPNSFELQGLISIIGVVAVLDVSAVVSTPSITLAVQGVDRLSGATWPILTSAAITATGTTVLRIHPDLTNATNSVAADVIPPVVRFVTTHSNANAITYTLAAYLSY